MQKRHKRFFSDDEAADLGLPLRRGDIRSDGFIFKRYYESGISNKIREIWQSEEAKEKDKARRRKAAVEHRKRKPRPAKYLTKIERDALGLPLRIGDTREDGYRFKQYYKRGNSICELWCNQENYDKIRYRKKKWQKKKRIANAKFAARVKRRYGCSICGYKEHTDALHFDHINPKEKKREISKMHTCSRTELKKEIKKCRILCANCHAVHTAKQREDNIL